MTQANDGNNPATWCDGCIHKNKCASVEAEPHCSRYEEPQPSQQHTPGPWVYIISDASEHVLHIETEIEAVSQRVIDEAKRIIGPTESASITHGQKEILRDHRSVTCANSHGDVFLQIRPAKLPMPFAAAPAMLDALDGIDIYCSDSLTGPVEGGITVKWLWDGVVELRKRAQAAIALAKKEK